MNTRPVEYVSHRPPPEPLQANYIVAEVQPEGGPHHALLSPKAWQPVTPLPVPDESTEPVLASLFLEHVPPQPNSASQQVFTVGRHVGDSARQAILWFFQRESLEVTSWGNDTEATEEAQAWARSEGTAGMARALAFEDGWLVYLATCPFDRLQEVGAALEHGMTSLTLGPDEPPSWAASL